MLICNTFVWVVFKSIKYSNRNYLLKKMENILDGPARSLQVDADI
jgi:hypothetical protein